AIVVAGQAPATGTGFRASSSPPLWDSGHDHEVTTFNVWVPTEQHDCNSLQRMPSLIAPCASKVRYFSKPARPRQIRAITEQASECRRSPAASLQRLARETARFALSDRRLRA